MLGDPRTPRRRTGRQTSAGVFADNLSRLMAARGLSQNQLAKEAGVGQTTLSALLSRRGGNGANPRLSTVADLARYFGIHPWQLLIPELPIELLGSSEFGELVSNYSHAPADGRKAIRRVAMLEAFIAGADGGGAST